MFFENHYKIESVFEEPDFIICSEKQRIGLEHQILIDNQSKEKEGFLENIIKLAEKELRQMRNMPNFFANIYLNPSFYGKINEKQKLVKSVVQIIRTYFQTGELVDNEIIEDIHIMEHSQISLAPNLGGWIQKNINEDLIRKAVSKKEEKISNYINNTNLPQWLLIVVGGVGESSYEIEKQFMISLETKFDKVYILEDYKLNLFELK